MQPNERLYELIADLFETEVSALSPETDFAEDLFADELDGMELAMMLEEEFDLTGLVDEDYSAYETVGDVSEALLRRLKEKGDGQ